MATASLPRNVCVVGGGRWARTIARILAKILPHGSRLNLCSVSNPQSWVDMQSELSGDGVTIAVCGFEEALANANIELIFVARSARENAQTAFAALRAGKRVFVEKPFALNEADASLVVNASTSGRGVTGLVFLLAPNLRRFRDRSRALGKLSHIGIEWLDPASEIRYAEAKSYDPSVNCLPDSFPHIWSVLRLIKPTAPFGDVSAKSLAGGRILQLDGRLGDTQFTVEIARDSVARRRSLTLIGEHGRASIDFSKEPGNAELNGTAIDVETGYSSPLTLELQAFLDNSEPELAQVENAIESIMIVDRLMGSIREQQAREIEAGFDPKADHVDADYALREIGLDALGGRNAFPDHQQLVVLLRGWLGGTIPDSDIPALLQAAPLLSTLKHVLDNRSISER